MGGRHGESRRSGARPGGGADGAFLLTIDGVDIDVQKWIDGAPLEEPENRSTFRISPKRSARLGAKMARLHVASDKWTLPDGFARISWDRAGLLGDAPVWGRFWENRPCPMKTGACSTGSRCGGRAFGVDGS